MILPSNRKIPEGEDAAREAEAPASRRASPRSGAAPTRAGRIIGVLRAALGVALVVGTAGAVAYSARRYVKSTPRFAVTDITVSGGAHRKEAEIVAISGLTKGKNLFATDLDAARAQLLADPWIRDAHLDRRLPGTISVAVVERRAAGLVAAGDTYLASADGELWKRLEPGDPTDLPIVTGLSVRALAQDRKGAEALVRRALELAAEYERSPLSRRSPLQEVHVTETGAMSLVVGKGALTLALGAPPFRRKLDHAAKVLAELERRGAKADAILLDDEARADRVVVRMR